MSSSGAEIYYEPTGCNCDGTSYSRDSINAAATKALQLASQGQTLGNHILLPSQHRNTDRRNIGRDKYPHAYNDYEHFNFPHGQAPYLEFPIEEGSKVYDGGSPGADRVVIGSIAEDYSRYVPFVWRVWLRLTERWKCCLLRCYYP